MCTHEVACLCINIYIYVLLFGVLNSKILYLLAFFHIEITFGLYLICKCTHITATIFFHLEQV